MILQQRTKHCGNKHLPTRKVGNRPGQSSGSDKLPKRDRFRSTQFPATQRAVKAWQGAKIPAKHSLCVDSRCGILWALRKVG